MGRNIVLQFQVHIVLYINVAVHLGLHLVSEEGNRFPRRAEHNLSGERDSTSSSLICSSKDCSDMLLSQMNFFLMESCKFFR